MFESSTDVTPISQLRPDFELTVRVDRRALLQRALRGREARSHARPAPLLMAWARLRLERGDAAADVLWDCLDDARLGGVRFVHGTTVAGVSVTHFARRAGVAVMVFATLSDALRSGDLARVARAGHVAVAVGLDEFARSPHTVLIRIAEAAAAGR